MSTPYSAGDASEESSHTHAHTRFIQAEEEEKEGDDETSGFVDVTAPHPEFVLSPPNTRVSSREFEDICEDLAPPNGKGELKNPQHPFLRALRRGERGGRPRTAARCNTCRAIYKCRYPCKCSAAIRVQWR